MEEHVAKKIKEDKGGGVTLRKDRECISEMTEQTLQEAFLAGYSYAIQVLQENIVDQEKTK